MYLVFLTGDYWPNILWRSWTSKWLSIRLFGERTTAAFSSL